MLDRVADLLMARAERSDVREEQTLCLDARGVLVKERDRLMSDFERNLRKLVDERMSGKIEPKEHFAQVDVKKLTLVDTSAMDESVLSGNIIRVVENQCESELRELNRGVGFLLGRPDLETAANPLAPTTIVEAFTRALHGIGGDERIKLTILKELNQTSLGDINAIYADLNRHLEGLQVLPKHRSADHAPAVGGQGRPWRRQDRVACGTGGGGGRPDGGAATPRRRQHGSRSGAPDARRSSAGRHPGALARRFRTDVGERSSSGAFQLRPWRRGAIGTDDRSAHSDHA